MTSTFSPNKNLQLQGTGDNVNTWGTILNSNVFSILDLNLGGRLNLSVAGSSNVTATQAQAANLLHNLTGILTGNISYILPNAGGLFLVKNATTGNFSLTVKPVGGTGVVVPQGKTALIFVNPDTTSADLATNYAMSLAQTTVASATTTDLGAAATRNILISGVTTITSFGSSASTSTPMYEVEFSGALTLTHNGTSLILPGGQNIKTAANDSARLLYLGSGNWIVLSYSRTSGQSASMTGPSTTIASATTTDVGSLGINSAIISGVTSITSLGSSASSANPIYFMRFTGILTLTHDGTALILPGSANITTAAGDAAIGEYLGSGNWRIISYQRASGQSLIPPGGTATNLASASTTDLGSITASNNIVITGTTPITAFGSSATLGNPIFYIRFSGALLLTYNATSLIIPGAANITTAAGDCALVEYLGSGNWRVREYFPASGNTITASLNGGQLAGFRNRAINGGVDNWQRGTSFTPGSSTITYHADRWCSLRTGAANYTVSRQTGPGNFSYCIRVQRDSGNASTVAIYTSQSFESLDSIALQGQVMSISFWARKGADFSATSNLLGIFCPSGTGTDENLLNGFTGSSTTLAQNVTLTTSWQRFTGLVSSALGAAITQYGIRFAFNPIGTASTNDYFEVAGLQIEVGGIATPFEYRNAATEIALCRRYYEKSFPVGTAPAQNAGLGGAVWQMQVVGASAAAQYGIRYVVPKRGTPTTLTLYNPSAANAQIRGQSTSTDFTLSTTAQSSELAFVATGTSPAATSLASIAAFHWSADAEIY